MLTPKGRAVSPLIFWISSRTAGRSPDEVSMIPMPPALETADARADRAIHPMGAWMMGYWMPSMSVMRVLIMTFPPGGSWSSQTGLE